MTEHYYAVSYGDDIYHHGIKGQKWGIRRFQNDDGTLTDAGRKRLYGKAGVEKEKYKNELASMRSKGASDKQLSERAALNKSENNRGTVKKAVKSTVVSSAASAGLMKAGAFASQHIWNTAISQGLANSSAGFAATALKAAIAADVGVIGAGAAAATGAVLVGKAIHDNHVKNKSINQAAAEVGVSVEKPKRG